MSSYISHFDNPAAMAIDSSEIIHGFHSSAAQLERLDSRTEGLLAALPAGITKTLIVRLEGGSYLGNVDRFALSQRDSGLFLQESGSLFEVWTEECWTLLSHREVCVCSEEAPQWESPEKCTRWTNIRGMRMSSEAGVKKRHRRKFFLFVTSSSVEETIVSESWVSCPESGCCNSVKFLGFAFFFFFF